MGLLLLDGLAASAFGRVDLLGAAAYRAVSIGEATVEQCQFVAKTGTTIEETSGFIKGMWNLWLMGKQSQWGTLAAVASLDWGEANAQSETMRWMSANLVELVVTIDNAIKDKPARERGRIKGRITLEMAMIVVPLTKPAQAAQLSKVGILEKLKVSDTVAADGPVREVVETAIKIAKAEKPVPPIIGQVKAELPLSTVGARLAGEEERTWGLYRMLRGTGRSENDAMLTAMAEVAANAGEVKVAARFKGVVDFRHSELPYSPSAVEYSAQFTVRNYKSLIRSKRVVVLEDGEALRLVRGADGFEGNHIIAEKFQKVLKLDPYNLSIGHVDDPPVGLLTINNHQRAESAFHKALNAWNGGIFRDRQVWDLGRTEFSTPSAAIDEYIRFLKSIANMPEFSNYPKLGRAFANKLQVPISE